jgi:hypothetical protein
VHFPRSVGGRIGVKNKDVMVLRWDLDRTVSECKWPLIACVYFELTNFAETHLHLQAVGDLIRLFRLSRFTILLYRSPGDNRVGIPFDFDGFFTGVSSRSPLIAPSL